MRCFFIREQEYDREKAVQYAKKWAYGRNPEYFNFDPIGGDCTNFISQCIFAGSKTMNYKPNGWYYKNGNDKSPSWTGVEFLYNFLTQNKGVGPYGEENKEKMQIGDVIQLSFDGIKFGHSLLVVKKEGGDFFTASHTMDTFGRNVNTYLIQKIRYIHIIGIRRW